MAEAERGPIAIVCGGGSFPGAVAEAIVRGGRQPVMFGIKGWADAGVIERYPHHWVAVGQLGRFFRLARSERCKEVLFIGTLLRPPLKQIFVSEGVLGRCRPTERDVSDIARAMKLIAALGPFDVGQAAIVANNNVLAVEAAEGTDNMLARIAELRRRGRVTTPPGIGVLVKAPKPGQDRRFDLPSIGPRTIEGAARAGLAGVAVAAGSTIIAEATEVIAMADREKIFVAGVGEDTAR
jgi:DUF1009 family protein